MKKIIILLLIFILPFILIGCNTKTTTNILGIKEKQTNDYISLPVESYVAEYDSILRYPIQLNFINENITFEMKSSHGVFERFDNIAIQQSIIKFSFNKEKNEIIYLYPMSKIDENNGCFIDVIIRENDNIIGYSIIKVYETNDITIKGELIKNVIFPDALKNKIIVLEESINYLSSQVKPQNNINDIYQEETDDFISIYHVYYDFTFFILNNNMKKNMSCLIYDFKYSLFENHNVTEYKYYYNEKNEYLSYTYDPEKIKEEDQYFAVIFIEREEICGYSIIKISYDEENNKALADIIVQMQFPNIYDGHYYIKQNISKEEVKLLIENKMNEINNK